MWLLNTATARLHEFLDPADVDVVTAVKTGPVLEGRTVSVDEEGEVRGSVELGATEEEEAAAVSVALDVSADADVLSGRASIRAALRVELHTR